MTDNGNETTDRSQLLEIYSIHVEMADRVSQRREGVNKLFVTLLSALVVLVAAILRFGPGTIPVGPGVVTLSVMGLLLTAAWAIVIQSYRQLNRWKFETLHDLEKHLSFPFYKIEWEKAGQGRDFRKYLKLTTAETFIPAIFAGMFVFVAIWTLLAY